jgi:uncharacterized cupredoxin-like copper-binding protein
MRLLCGVLPAIFAGLAAAHGESHAVKQAARPAAAEEAAFGRVGDARKVTRTIRVEMSDKMRFSPSKIDLTQNDTVRFVVKNSGKQLHEMVLGTIEELREHAALMKKHPGMEHDEPYMAHVAPGGTQTMLWQFTEPGEYYFGCLVPGHFEAGMVGRITVVAKGERR